ncbi:MAG: SprT-like domain-containing protein [Planctomycetes bacterium]|nr:SprT-like domain-containing protein [Planctomycetota bacterium]MCB9884635.1 SprT-like domain-containing protein [Planctomycetota bacterium]
MTSSRGHDLPSAEELQRRAAQLLADWRVPDAAIDVAWNDRLKTSAGRAFVRHGRIELNPHLLGRAPEQVQMVLTHEAAHIAAARLFGPAVPAHGRHWRSLMRLAGLPPKVTHDIPIEPRRRPRRRRHLYLRVCDGCGDRRILQAVRYGRCQGCDARDRFLVLRAAANPSGRRALENLSLADVRAKCASSILPGDW